MIKIQDKSKCTGCNACVQRCPKQCISMTADQQGFLYPMVDFATCIDCGLCERVCPILNQGNSRLPEKVYAAMNVSDDIRLSSSSGGVFSAIATSVIQEGGVVFGARFDEDWNVKHDYTDTIKGLKAFQGSKYVQSDIGQSFIDAERFLKEGRRVLFTGTPCQIHGLNLFLRKDYGDSLVKVEIICHGVPSPMIWREYLKTQCAYAELISQISFRDKSKGWEQYGFSISGTNQGTSFYEPMQENLYMNMFLRDVCLRPSCYACPSKGGKSSCDVTLGDFWSIKNHYPELYNSKGVSAVLIHSQIGEIALQSGGVAKSEVDYSAVLAGNSSIEQCAAKPKSYDRFWKYINEYGIPLSVKDLEHIIRPNILVRTVQKSKRIIYNIVKRFHL